MTKKNQHLGSDFDEFLAEQDLLVDAHVAAVKRVVAHQIHEEMKRRHLSNTAMAKRMGTSRMQLDRLLDPANTSVTLRTLERAAVALKRKLRVELV